MSTDNEVLKYEDLKEEFGEVSAIAPRVTHFEFQDCKTSRDYGYLALFQIHFDENQLDILCSQLDLLELGAAAENVSMMDGQLYQNEINVAHDYLVDALKNRY